MIVVPVISEGLIATNGIISALSGFLRQKKLALTFGSCVSFFAKKKKFFFC
jgi:hypothetical protein